MSAKVGLLSLPLRAGQLMRERLCRRTGRLFLRSVRPVLQMVGNLLFVRVSFRPILRARFERGVA
jgi:hypothetical protein